LDSIQETATGDMETLLNGLSASSDQASDLKFLSGENNANLQKSTAEAMHAFNGLLGKRLGGDCNTADYLTNPASSPRAKMGNTGSAASNYAFACGYGQFSKVQANGGAGAVESTLAGGAAGVEIRPTSPSVVRFGIGYARDDMELKSTSDTTTVNSIQAGVYAQHDLVEGREGKAYVGATLSGGYNMADTERHVVAGPIVRIAKGDVSGYNLSAGALLGALFRVGNVNIEPIASAEYIYNNQDSYTESGAGAGNLSVSGRETNLLRSSAGGQVNAVLPVGRDMTMVPQVHGAFIYDALDVNPGIHQSIGGAGFNVKGARPGRMGYEAGGGLTLNVNKKLSLFGDYNGTFRDHETDHSFLGGLKVNW
ncbi:MAG: autotransporter outer membrane beta-barrel domain-containing protein, partial [Proteobacteria bacterium]|nr:autotransporter outer membrane beta-barrel domain-containing protein [Pseudomonadota bacterium]